MNTKKLNITYWLVTSIFAAYMLFTSLGMAVNDPQAIEIVTGLGYPAYFTQLIGIVKILGCIAILVPGFPRIKDWAYSGFFFDLAVLTYSIICTAGGLDILSFSFIMLPIGVLFWSYYLMTKKYPLVKPTN